MARKLQIKRGAKADLPVLSQGEFGMVTDSNAEELHLGTGSKNIHVPTVGVYYDDMNALVRSGIYRVGTNTNLPEGLWYGQVLVMQGADSDTVAQIGMGYTTSTIISRAGQKVDGAWTFTEWAEAGAGGDFVTKDGDYMFGVLNMYNTADYIGIQKTREVNDVLYHNVFGVGSDTTRGASGSMRLTNDAGDVLGRLDLWADGTITHKVGSGDYTPLSKAQVVSYTGTGTSGSSSPTTVTFDFAPKFVMMLGTDNGNLHVAPNFGVSSNANTRGILIPDAMTTTFTNYHGLIRNNSTTPLGKKSADGKTFYWYGGDATAQFNNSSYKYYILGIG